MQVKMKNEINYFEKDDEDFKYFTEIFKTKEQLELRDNLIHFNFGEKRFYNLAPNSQDNLISAELEFKNNKNNPLYDFSSVVLQYSKMLEKELHIFFKDLILAASKKNQSILNVEYELQGRTFTLDNILLYKANYGTYKFLLSNPVIVKIFNEVFVNKRFLNFVFSSIPYYINIMQKVRNEAVHGGTTSFEDCNEIRKEIIGIGKSSVLVELDRMKKFI